MLSQPWAQFPWLLKRKVALITGRRKQLGRFVGNEWIRFDSERREQVRYRKWTPFVPDCLSWTITNTNAHAYAYAPAAPDSNTNSWTLPLCFSSCHGFLVRAEL